MNLRNIIAAICLFGSLACGAQAKPQTLFPYPEAPDELETLQDRTTYLVDHFWDRCNLQSAILNRDGFRNAFLDYISFMPYAQADNVHASIDRLTTAYAKSPDHLLTIAELAEDAVYNGEAGFLSDEIFLRFAKAAIANKKISKTAKARLSHEAKVVEQTQTGRVAPELKYTLRDGSAAQLSDTRGTHVLLFVNDPDCDDCRMARIRLSADHNVNRLLDDGLLRIVSIFPGDYSAQWAQDTASYNPRWIVGASPDIDEAYDLRATPAIYYLNPQGEILSKTATAEQLLEGFHVANTKMNR